MKWFSLAMLFLFLDQTLAQTEGGEVTISVSAGTTPTFIWTPSKGIGRLVVKEGDEELWVAETDGVNFFHPPIRYGVHPGVADADPATPLITGRTYSVSLYRWVSENRQESQLLGEREFSLSVDSVDDQKATAKALKREEEDPPGVETPEKEAPGEKAKEEDEDSDAGPRRALRVGAQTTDFTFDGVMNEPVWWAATDSIADLITIEPEEGGVPAGRTIVKVLADQNEIVVGVRCFESEPEQIVSFSKSRDSKLDEEDHIALVFDTFQDGRSGYVFAVNPSGARFDGLVIGQGEDVNSEWDMIWQAKTFRDDSGWSAEIRIPIKSLSFEKGLTEWGFNIQRRVQRLQETSRWSSAKRDFEFYQTNRAGLLTGLPDFDLGLGLSIRPSIVGGFRKPERGVKTKTEGDLSLDVTQKLGPNILSSLTINTDFAETEVDVRQVNLTRFPLFFPEKRTFFLEGADIFEFGLGLDEDNLLPFFSRRIGLLGLGEDDQSEVPINVGGKINGRVDDTNFGALVVNTRKIDSLAVTSDLNVHVPMTTMGAMRIKQNILEESSIGVLATFGDQQGRSKSWSGGVDFTYRTSSFLNDKTLLVGVWGLFNNREDLQGDRSAYGLRVDYPNDLFDVNFTTILIGDGFDPSLGFVPRKNIHLWDLTGDYKLRPAWSLVRQMTHELSFRLFNDRSNSRWESYALLIKPLDWLFESGDRLQAGIMSGGDRPPGDFELATDVDIQAGSYTWTRYFLEGRSAEKRVIGGQLRWESGNYYNGDLSTLKFRVTLKPSAFLALEFTGERSTGKVMALPDSQEDPLGLVGREFIEELFGFRVQLNFSPDLQFSSLTQYDTQSKELGSNNKLRWTFDPLGDIFIVYNHKLVRNADDRWQFVSNQLPIKIQYAWRF